MYGVHFQYKGASDVERGMVQAYSEDRTAALNEAQDEIRRFLRQKVGKVVEWRIIGMKPEGEAYKSLETEWAL